MDCMTNALKLNANGLQLTGNTDATSAMSRGIRWRYPPYVRKIVPQKPINTRSRKKMLPSSAQNWAFSKESGRRSHSMKKITMARTMTLAGVRRTYGRTPGIFKRMVYKLPLAMMYNVFPSIPPQLRLPVRSGTSIVPICSSFGEKIQMPPGPVL